MNRSESVFTNSKYRLICLFCSKDLENSTKVEINAHLTVCEVTAPEQLKSIKNSVMNYHSSWKANYSDILKVHQVVSDGNNPFDDKECICDSQEEHAKKGCGREKLYRMAARPYFNLLSMNFPNYLSEKQKLEAQIMVNNNLLEIEKANGYEEKKKLNARHTQNQKEAELSWSENNAFQRDQFVRESQRLRDQHVMEHRRFDKELDRITKE